LVEQQQIGDKEIKERRNLFSLIAGILLIFMGGVFLIITHHLAEFMLMGIGAGLALMGGLRKW
jgi:hypothetical protein